ncbi:hypothetical protein EKH55_3042 [Sinorhizobium alkalisoli]|nr:hypothetical protein EKH55_3042 [Sinorhizobium alkalisoli]
MVVPDLVIEGTRCAHGDMSIELSEYEKAGGSAAGNMTDRAIRIGGS